MLAIAGLTIFSVVSRSSLEWYSTTRGSEIEDAERRVFAPERMRIHFHLFETLTLPSMAEIAKRHRRFRYFIFTTSNMPPDWRTRLSRSVAPYAWCHVVAMPPEEPVRDRVRSEAVKFANGDPLFSFRIDDDDALSAKYLDAVMAYAQPGKGFALERGIYLCLRSGIAATAYKPLIAIGLGLYASDGKTTIVDMGDHSRVEEKIEVVRTPGENHWIRTLHGGNDSIDSMPAKAHLSAHDLGPILEIRFPWVSSPLRN